MATTMNGLDMVRGLVQRGYSPYHAAALAGHMLQESGGDPTNVNKAEDAHGLLQWRLDRWQNLQNFAKEQGKDPTDPEVQLDFVGREMRGPEAKAGRGFLEAKDVTSASAALRPFIRFGDKSDGTRLNNSVGLLNQYSGGNATGAPPQDPVSPINPTSTGAPPMDISAPVGALAQGSPISTGLGSLSSALTGGAQEGKTSAPQQPDFLPVQQMQMAQANPAQSQQIAAALSKSYGWG